MKLILDPKTPLLFLGKALRFHNERSFVRQIQTSRLFQKEKDQILNLEQWRKEMISSRRDPRFHLSGWYPDVKKITVVPMLENEIIPGFVEFPFELPSLEVDPFFISGVEGSDFLPLFRHLLSLPYEERLSIYTDSINFRVDPFNGFMIHQREIPENVHLRPSGYTRKLPKQLLPEGSYLGLSAAIFWLLVHNSDKTAEELNSQAVSIIQNCRERPSPGIPQMREVSLLQEKREISIAPENRFVQQKLIEPLLEFREDTISTVIPPRNIIRKFSTRYLSLLSLILREQPHREFIKKKNRHLLFQDSLEPFMFPEILLSQCFVGEFKNLNLRPFKSWAFKRSSVVEHPSFVLDSGMVSLNTAVLILLWKLDMEINVYSSSPVESRSLAMKSLENLLELVRIKTRVDLRFPPHEEK